MMNQVEQCHWCDHEGERTSKKKRRDSFYIPVRNSWEIGKAVTNVSSVCIIIRMQI